MATGIQDYRDLRVWHAGMGQVEDVYHVSRSFPSHELYGLTSQVRRAVVSVPANIAEGHTRGHIKEYLQHLSIARGSLAEVETHLEIALRLTYLSPEDRHRIQSRISSLARQLIALRDSLIRSQREKPPVTRHPSPVTRHRRTPAEPS